MNSSDGFLKRVLGKYSKKDRSMNFHKGDLVEVLSNKEISCTLDQNGTLEGLPFLPEMNKFCGRRFQVLKQVKKVLVEGEQEMRQIRDTVILVGVFCDGEAHGGCQRCCPILWKEAWLREVR
jgi:hypothetical protein